MLAYKLCIPTPISPNWPNRPNWPNWPNWYNVYTATPEGQEWQGAVHTKAEFTDLMGKAMVEGADPECFTVDHIRCTITTPYYALNKGQYDVDVSYGALIPEWVD